MRQPEQITHVKRWYAASLAVALLLLGWTTLWLVGPYVDWLPGPAVIEGSAEEAQRIQAGLAIAGALALAVLLLAVPTLLTRQRTPEPPPLTVPDSHPEMALPAPVPPEIEIRVDPRHRREAVWIRTFAERAALRFNHLLTSVVGYSDLLLESVSKDDPLHEGLREISDAGRRAARLSRALQRAGRAEPSQREPIDAQAVLREVLATLEEDPLAGAGLNPALEESEAWLVADQTQLELVFHSLAARSLEALSGEGRVTVRTRVSPWEDAKRCFVCEFACESPSGAVGFPYLAENTKEEDALEFSVVRSLLSRNGGTLEMVHRPQPLLRVVVPVQLGIAPSQSHSQSQSEST